MLLEITLFILIGLMVVYYKYQKQKFKKRLQDPEYFKALVSRHDMSIVKQHDLCKNMDYRILLI
ncbi:hypothetical protein VCHA40P240_50275 [Vibrio chagasii]|nr:hypothetical protein VCHA40P240_50275 [Vibrio chagasii]